MEYVLQIVISVMAGIITYVISKWLDRNNKDS